MNVRRVVIASSLAPFGRIRVNKSTNRSMNFRRARVYQKKIQSLQNTKKKKGTKLKAGSMLRNGLLITKLSSADYTAVAMY